MSREKAKGDRFERDVVAVLRRNGFPHAERVLRLGAHTDFADITGVPGLHIECRDRGKVELGAWLSLLTVEARHVPSDPVPVLVVKRRQRPAEQAYVVLELGRFARLIAEEATV